MTASYDVWEAGGLKIFFKNVGKATFAFGNTFANNPVKALDIGSNFGTSKKVEIQVKGYQQKLIWFNLQH